MQKMRRSCNLLTSDARASALFTLDLNVASSNVPESTSSSSRCSRGSSSSKEYDKKSNAGAFVVVTLAEESKVVFPKYEPINDSIRRVL